jgi:hypothetical protein
MTLVPKPELRPGLKNRENHLSVQKSRNSQPHKNVSILFTSPKILQFMKHMTFNYLAAGGVFWEKFN